MARPREFDEAAVVQAATAVFWEQGYRRTTPKDLMAATGLSKSSLYNTFGSKAGLFARAVERYVCEQEQFIGAMLGEGTLRQGLQTMGDATVAMVGSESGPNACLLATASIELEPDDVELCAQVAASRQRVEDVIAARVAQAQADGEIPSNDDPAALARFIQNNNMGLIVLARSGATVEQLQEVANRLVAVVCG
jgi:TetR/AcrR family transcriptional repressor of nem operon